MWNHERNLMRGNGVLFQNIPGGFFHPADGVLKNLFTLHLEEVVATGQRGGGRGGVAATARDAEEIDAVAIGTELGAEEPDVGLGGGAHHDGAGAITKEHAGGAVFPIDDGGEFFGPDHEGVTVTTGADHRTRGVESVDKAGARGVEIETRGRGREPEFMLNDARGGGHGEIGRDGRNDQQVDISELEFGVGDGETCGVHGHVGGRFAGRGDVAFADAAAGANPLVGRLNGESEFGVGEDASGGVRTGAENNRGCRR